MYGLEGTECVCSLSDGRISKQPQSLSNKLLIKLYTVGSLKLFQKLWLKYIYISQTSLWQYSKESACVLYLLLRKLHVVVQGAETIAVTIFSRSECISPGALVCLCSQEFLSVLISINKCNLCTSKKNKHLKKEYSVWSAERLVYARPGWRWDFSRCVTFSHRVDWQNLIHQSIHFPAVGWFPLLRWRSDQLLKTSSTQGVWSLSYSYVHVQLIYCIKVIYRCLKKSVKIC